MISIILCKIPTFILTKLGNLTSEEIEIEIFEELYLKDRERIFEIRKENAKLKRVKIFLFFIFYLIFSGFCLYYTTIFCIIYNGSSNNWIADGFFGLFIDFLILFLKLFVLSLIRILLINYQNR
jgi:hypothetical protein